MAYIFVIKVITLLIFSYFNLKIGYASLIFIIPTIVLFIFLRNKIFNNMYIFFIWLLLLFVSFDSIYTNFLPEHKSIERVEGIVKYIKANSERTILHIENKYFKVLAYIKSYLVREKINKGDTLILEGSFKPINEKNYFYSENFTHKGYAKSVKVISKSFPGRLDLLFSNSDFSYMLRGLLLGDRSNIPDTIMNKFRSTSLIHLLAISGLHIGIIVSFIYIIVMFLPIAKRYKMLIIFIILLLYGFLLGFIPSAVRAIVFSGLIMISYFYNKKISLVDALFATGFLIFFFRPQTLYSIGFWLSFLATLGILYFMPVLKMVDNKIKNRILAYTLNGILVSIAAQLFIFPLMLYVFGRLNLVSIFVSLPLSLVLTFIIYWAIIGLILSFLLFLNQIFINAADFGILVFIKLLEIIDRLKLFEINTKIGVISLVLFYIVIFIGAYFIVIRIKKKESYGFV